MASLNYVWAGILVDELIRCGITCFCLAPGSRSTPLTAAVAQHPQARSIMHFDERGTAYFALGYARAEGKPAAWITTSGTAVANGLPAVVEADADDVPMLLLTSDRPPELRETGANQTIRQADIFQGRTRWHFDLPAPTPPLHVDMLHTTVDQAAYRARRGPVHLNCMFRKPLEPEADDGLAPVADRARKRHFGTKSAHTSYGASSAGVSLEEIEVLAAHLQRFERGLLVAGRLPAGGPQEAIMRLARQMDWPLLTDITSGLRLGPYSELRIAHYDLLLGDPAFRKKYVPDAVLYLGHPAVSERLGAFISDAQPSLYALAADSPARLDPAHQVTHRYETPVGPFCNALAHAMPEPSSSLWIASWLQNDLRVQKELAFHFGIDRNISEPAVAHALSEHLPEHSGLFLASSMPVRDMGRFASGDGVHVTVGANRGASGIDGTVASAAGFAFALRRPVTLLIGDLALLHDLNSLALLQQAGAPVIVIAINNDGGGIFSFLPIADYPRFFEPYFGTPHGLTFEAAADMFALPYVLASSTDALAESYVQAIKKNRSTLIEVRTDRKDNQRLHVELDQLVQEAIAPDTHSARS